MHHVAVAQDVGPVHLAPSFVPQLVVLSVVPVFFGYPRSSSKNKSPGGVGWPQAANEPSANTHKAAQRGTTEINENLMWRSMSESQDSKGTAGVKFSHHSNL